MGGYIGARAGVGLVNTTLGSVQDLTATDASPEVTLINNTHEDSDGGREGKVIFKGQQSGGEESTLAEIEANHLGSSDDEKGQLVFRTNDGSDGASPTEAMRITSGQRLGLGDIDPDNIFNIKESELSGRSASNGNTSMTLEHATDTGIQFFSATQTQLRFGDAASTGAGSIIYTHSDNVMKFATDGSEAIRLASDGALFVGTTSNPSGGKLAIDYARGTSAGMRIKDTVGSGGTGVIADFYNSSNSSVGSITHNSSSTSYNTSSDYRLKENVTNLTDGITRVKQLAPKRFNFIADADTTVDGFLAHEAQTVVPEAITGTKDEVDDDNNPVMQGIDQSKLVPLLTAALQEAIAKIETLETKVAALEAE